MRPARVLAPLAVVLGIVAGGPPAAADACEAELPGTDELELSVTYLYRKVDASGEASWQNSGRQTLLDLRYGHSWLAAIAATDLPAGVCGDGWAVQEDQLRGLAREDVPWVVDRATGEGVLGWPPVVTARHVDLASLVDVPDCAAVVEVPTTTVPSGPGPGSATGQPGVVASAVAGAPAATPVRAAPAFAG